jgi:hypothetical protein
MNKRYFDVVLTERAATAATWRGPVVRSDPLRTVGGVDQ